MGGDALRNSPNISCDVLKNCNELYRILHGQPNVKIGLNNVIIKGDESMEKYLLCTLRGCKNLSKINEIVKLNFKLYE